MSLGFNIGESLRCYPVVPATTSAADQTGDYVNCRHCSSIGFIISFGHLAATSTIQVLESPLASGVGAVARKFSYYWEKTAWDDTLPIVATCASTGLVVPASDGVFALVVLDSADLTDGYGYLTTKISNAGANSLSSTAVMAGMRYATSPGITVLV